MDTNRRRALARAPWKTRTSRPVYENPWMRLREDVAELPDGRTTIYGVVQCKPAVGVLPFLDDDTVVLVGQYRYVFGEFSWEMPTGARTRARLSRRRRSANWPRRRASRPQTWSSSATSTPRRASWRRSPTSTWRAA